MAQLDAVYAFALTLTGGDAERAAALTESAFAIAPAELWPTLGAQGIRDWLLARCLLAFTSTPRHSLVG